MEIQLIRNATIRLNYSGRALLLDPFLAPKGTLPTFAGLAPNPLVDLPLPPEQIVADVQAVVVSHLHSDHFDDLARRLLPKDLPIFCQPVDEARLLADGFHSVTPVEEVLEWEGITLERTLAQHGTGKWVERMGPVSGFVFRASREPTLYWAGDTIWYPEVEKVVHRVGPQVIITHSSGARFGDGNPIVMDAEQTVSLCKAAPNSVVVAVHLESLDHGTVTRTSLRTFADTHGISSERLLTPNDGDTLAF